MVRALRQKFLVLCVALSACSPRLDLPEEAVVACRSDSDCQKPLGVCLAGLCRQPGTTLDTEPANLVSADATSAVSVRLIFSEPLSTQVVDNASISIDALSVQAVALSADGRTLTITTAAQEPTVSYTLTARALTDIEGNSSPDISVAFVGFGVLDKTAPELLAPAADAIVARLAALLVWVGRQGAPGYEVEIASDQLMANPISGSPFRTDAATTNLNVTFPAAGRYLWRVRVLATGSSPSEAQALGVLDETVHVGCSTVSCGVGSADAPVASIREALAIAQTFDLSTVLVASSVGTPSPITIDRALALRGGFNSTFTVQQASSAPSAIATDSVCLTIAANDVWVEGFSCTTTSPLPAIAVTSAERVTVQDVSVVSSPATVATGVVIASAIDVVFSRVKVSFCRAQFSDGNCQDPLQISSPGVVTAMRVSASSVTINNSELLAGGNVAGVGLDVGRGATVSVHNSILSGGPPYYDLDTVQANEPSYGYGLLSDLGDGGIGSIVVQDSRVDAGVRYKQECAAVTHRRGSLTLERNYLAGCKREGVGAPFAAGSTRGVDLRPRRVQDLPSAELINNVIVAGENTKLLGGSGDWESVGVDIGSASQAVVLTHNLIQASTGTRVIGLHVGNKLAQPLGVEVRHNVLAVTGATIDAQTPTDSGTALMVTGDTTELIAVSGNLVLDSAQRTLCRRNGSIPCATYVSGELLETNDTMAILMNAPNDPAQPLQGYASADFSWKTSALPTPVDVLSRLSSAVKDIRNNLDRPLTGVSYGPFQR